MSGLFSGGGLSVPNDKNPAERLKDEALAAVSGGYVIVNNVGCYELYTEDGKYEATFRGDQLAQLRKYAKKHGISDEFRSSG